MNPNTEMHRNLVQFKLGKALGAATSYYEAVERRRTTFDPTPRVLILTRMRAAKLKGTKDIRKIGPVSLLELPLAEGGTDPLRKPILGIDWPIDVLQIVLARIGGTTTGEAVVNVLALLDPIIAWTTIAPVLGHEGQTLHPNLASSIHVMANMQGCYGPWTVRFRNTEAGVEVLATMGADPNVVLLERVPMVRFVKETRTWIYREDEPQYRMDRVAVLDGERVEAAKIVARADAEFSEILKSRDPEQAVSAINLYAKRNAANNIVKEIEARIRRHLFTIEEIQRGG